MEKGRTAEVPGLKAGDYQVEFYDTKTGKILEKSTVTAEGETLTLLLPGFSGDLAVKLKPKEKDTLWESSRFSQTEKKFPNRVFTGWGNPFRRWGGILRRKRGIPVCLPAGFRGFPAFR